LNRNRRNEKPDKYQTEPSLQLLGYFRVNKYGVSASLFWFLVFAWYFPKELDILMMKIKKHGIF